METKKCLRCDRTLPVSEFTVNRARADGLQGYCRECMKTYRKEHYKNNKQPYLDRAKDRNNKIRASTRKELVSYLKENPCVDCGESDIRVLQFDHKEPTQKTRSISDMVRRATAWKTILLEIEKCQVRCANCHMKRTAIQFGWWMDKLEVVEDEDMQDIGI